MTFQSRKFTARNPTTTTRNARMAACEVRNPLLGRTGIGTLGRSAGRGQYSARERAQSNPRRPGSARCGGSPRAARYTARSTREGSVPLAGARRAVKLVLRAVPAVLAAAVLGACG